MLRFLLVFDVRMKRRREQRKIEAKKGRDKRGIYQSTDEDLIEDTACNAP